MSKVKKYEFWVVESHAITKRDVENELENRQELGWELVTMGINRNNTPIMVFRKEKK